MSTFNRQWAPSEEDLAFVAAFEGGDIPPGDFRHRDHVRLAWTYLCQAPLDGALARFTTRLKDFAASAGHPEKYHETITWAYMVLINERMQRGADGSWQAFADANPDLLDYENSILNCYYTPETLGSALARKNFLMPDR